MVCRMPIQARQLFPGIDFLFLFLFLHHSQTISFLCFPKICLFFSQRKTIRTRKSQLVLKQKFKEERIELKKGKSLPEKSSLFEKICPCWFIFQTSPVLPERHPFVPWFLCSFNNSNPCGPISGSCDPKKKSPSPEALHDTEN